MSTTRRAFRGEMRTRVAFALTSIARPLSSCAHSRLSASALVGVPGVPAIRSCRSKLAEFVSYHLLTDIDRDMLPTVMHRHRVTDHAGENCRSARPGAHNGSLITCIEV